MSAPCASLKAATFSEIIRRASLAACGPPEASRIKRNAMTRCMSAPKRAASIQAFMTSNKAFSLIGRA